jgi:catalase
VGTGNRKPINILQNIAHEYVHFIQWREGDNAWITGDGDLIEGSSYVELEKRTERDAIALLRDWGIPANYNAMRMRSKAYIAHLRRTET